MKAETKELRFQIQKARSQKELERIVKRNRAVIHEHSFMKFVVENAMRTLRHIEIARNICQTYFRN